MGGLLCVALLSGALSWELPLPGFELVWTHSVERVEWPMLSSAACVRSRS